MADLKSKTEPINREIIKLEKKLRMVNFGITQADRLEYRLTDAFKTIGDILMRLQTTYQSES